MKKVNVKWFRDQMSMNHSVFFLAFFSHSRRCRCRRFVRYFVLLLPELDIGYIFFGCCCSAAAWQKTDTLEWNERIARWREKKNYNKLDIPNELPSGWVLERCSCYCKLLAGLNKYGVDIVDFIWVSDVWIQTDKNGDYLVLRNETQRRHTASDERWEERRRNVRDAI